MVIVINGSEIECISFEKTTDSLKLFGTPEGNLIFSGINWNLVELPQTLDEIKSAKITELETAYQNQISSGYFDVETEYTLFLSEKSIDDYAKMKAVIQDFNNAEIVKIGTYTGWHEITKEVCYNLLIRYGRYTLDIITKLKMLTTQVNYSETEEAVNAVSW